jgi:hypothetical protein
MKIFGKSLPPLVTGERRGEVEVSVLHLSLHDNQTASVSPRWWGSQERDEESEVCRLFPTCSTGDASEPSIASALIEADTIVKNGTPCLQSSIIYPIIAELIDLNRYFSDASTLSLLVQSGVEDSQLGMASIHIKDTLGCGQLSLVGVANVKNESRIIGSLVFMIRVRIGQDSSLLADKLMLSSRTEIFHTSNDTSSLMSTESYLTLLAKRRQEVKKAESTSNSESSFINVQGVNNNSTTNNIVDLDITYPLAASMMHKVTGKKESASTPSKDQLITSPSLTHSQTNREQKVPSPASSSNSSNITSDIKSSTPSLQTSQTFALLQTSFEVAEQVASRDVHNLLPTPSSLLYKKSAADEREKKVRNLSGGLVGRASSGTSPVFSSPQQLHSSSPHPIYSLSPVSHPHNPRNNSPPNTSNGLVSLRSSIDDREILRKSTRMLDSPFADTAPRPDGVNEVFRAGENHESLQNVDIWSSEALSSANCHIQKTHSKFEEKPHHEESPSPSLHIDSNAVTEAPSLWLAGIAQPESSRSISDQQLQPLTSASTSKNSIDALNKLLNRSSTTLKEIDEALIIGRNVGGAGPLHARAAHTAAATALGAQLKAASSTLTSTDFLTTFPSTLSSNLSSNLSKSDAILIAYQEVVSALDSGAFGSKTMAAFGNNFDNNLSITSALLGVDPRTMSIIKEANSSSKGGFIVSEKSGDETNTKPSNSLRSNMTDDSISSVLRDASIDYTRLKDALATAESALRLPSLSLLGERLRSLSKNIHGISVSLSAAVLFPAATITSAHQSSGRFGSIALLAIGEEKNDNVEKNNNSQRNPRVLKQQSAQALKDWLGGCKIWLEYTIPPAASATKQRCSHSNARDDDEGGESQDVYSSWIPGAASSVSVMSQPVAISSHSQTSSNDHLIGDGKIRSKSSSPEKPISATTSSIRKTSSPPPRGSPLRLSKTSNAAGTSSSSSTTPPKQIPLSTQIPSPDTAQLLLASLPPPSLSIPPGHVIDWDMSHSAMNLDSLIHTRENELVFDDEGLSRWLGSVKEERQGDEMITDSSSSIIVRMYLDASSQHQNMVNSKSAAVSTLPLKGKPPSPPKGYLSAADSAAAAAAPSSSLTRPSSSSSFVDERVLIGEGRLPLRQLLLSDSLSFETTVDVLNINSPSQLRSSRISQSEKTLSTLRQVRSTSLNATSDASLVGPPRISADVVKARQEAFLSSLSLSSEEREKVQRALAVRIGAAQNDTVESKRAVAEALSPLNTRIDVIEEIGRSAENQDSSLSCNTKVSSEVVARVRMRVSLLHDEDNDDMRSEPTLSSSHTLIDTLRSLPQEPTETKSSLQINHKIRSLSREVYLDTRPQNLSSHSYSHNLRSVLGPDWETLRLPASSFILPSTSGGKKTRDKTKKGSFSFSQSSRHSSSLKSSVSDLARVLLGESDAGEKESEEIVIGNDQGCGSSLIISLHSLSSVSPRSALTAIGDSPSILDKSSAPVDKTRNSSSIVSLFIRAQSNRAIFSIPRDKPHIDIPSARILNSDVVTASSIPLSSSTLPKFSISSDLVLPIRAPSSIKDAEGLASALFSSNRSGCVLEVYGFIAISRNTSNVNESTPLKHFQLISQEPILLGTVFIPLAGVADALTSAARSESSLWDGPERITSCPNVLQIVHPTVEEWSSCGQLSLSLWAAANGRQALVFTGQSSAALEIQKWWSIIVVFLRKRRMEEEKRRRMEEEEEMKRKAEEIERAKVEKVTGKKTQKRLSPVLTGQVGAVSGTTAAEAVAAVIKDMKEKSPIQPDEILQSSTFQFQQSISRLATPWDVESILPSQVDAEMFPQTDLQLTQKGDNSAQPESNLDSSASYNVNVVNMITSDESLSTQHIDMSIKGPDSSEESPHAEKSFKNVIPLVQDVEVQTDGIILVDGTYKDSKSTEDIVTSLSLPSDTFAVVPTYHDRFTSDKENEEGSSQPSLIADHPRLRIDGLIDSNNERETELLPSSHALFPTSSQDEGYLKLSIDDFLLQLECEEFDNAANAYNNLDEVNEEKIDTISEIDDIHVQVTLGIAETMTTNDVEVYEFTKHEVGSEIMKKSNVLTSSDRDNKIFTSSEGRMDESKSFEKGVEAFQSLEQIFHVNNQTEVLEVVNEDVGPAHSSDISINHPKQTNSTHVPVVSDIVIDSSEALIFQSNNVENDFVNDEHSEAEIYSLDFESVTHMEEEHENNIEESEEEEEDDSDDNEMNSAENAADIPGYIIPNDNEEISMESDSVDSELISHCVYSNNQFALFESTNHQNGIESQEAEDQDQHLLRAGQERISYISFNQLNSQHLNKRLNVYKDQMHKESTDLSLSRSASPESLLELLLRQEELYFQQGDDNKGNDGGDNLVYNTDNTASDNDDAIYNTINRASNEDSGNISADRNRYHRLSDMTDRIPTPTNFNIGFIAPDNHHRIFTSSSTVPTSNSITLSEIVDALASTEHTINFNLDERVDEDRHMDESPSETVSQLLGATFEAELSASVALDDREKVNAPIAPSISINHITSDVSAWNDLVAVVDRWVESQRRTLPSSSVSSGEPEVNVTLPSKVSDKEPEQLVPVSIPVIGTIFVSANLSQERRLYLERLITENSALISQVDSIHVPVVNHTDEKISETIENHTRLRESLGLPMSKESSSLSSLSSRKLTNDHTTRSKTIVSSSAEEAKRTPKRFLDVRNTDKLAALLRGVR